MLHRNEVLAFIEKCNVRGRRYIGYKASVEALLIAKTENAQWYGQSTYCCYDFTPEFSTLRELNAWLARH
jgi:hypothetical protein